MGINNALMGGNIRWRPWDGVTLKVVAGVPQKFQEYAPVRIYGTDGEIDLGSLLFPENGMLLSVGGSWVLRDDRSDEHNVKADRVVRNYAGRLDLSKGIFSLGGEYVAKSRSLYWDDAYNIRYGKGRNVLLYAGIDAPGIGFSISFCILFISSLSISIYLSVSWPPLPGFLPACGCTRCNILLSCFLYISQFFPGNLPPPAVLFSPPAAPFLPARQLPGYISVPAWIWRSAPAL